MGGILTDEVWGSKMLSHKLPQECCQQIKFLSDFYANKIKTATYIGNYSTELIYFHELGNLYYTLRDADHLYDHLCNFRIMYYFTTRPDILTNYLGFLRWTEVNERTAANEEERIKNFNFTCFCQRNDAFNLNDQFTLTSRLIEFASYVGNDSLADSLINHSEILLRELPNYTPSPNYFFLIGDIFLKNILTVKKGRESLKKGADILQSLKQVHYHRYCEMYKIAGKIENRVKSTASAIQYANYGLDLLKKYNDINSTFAAHFYNIIAMAHSINGNGNEAGLYLEKAEKIFLANEGQYSEGLAETYYIKGMYYTLIFGVSNFHAVKSMYKMMRKTVYKTKIGNALFENNALAQYSIHETNKSSLDYYEKALLILDKTTGLNTAFAEQILIEMKWLIANLENKEREYYSYSNLSSKFDTLPHSIAGKDWEFILDNMDKGWKQNRKGCILWIGGIIAIIALIVTLVLWGLSVIAELILKLLIRILNY
jgi:hypothetical protein